MGTVFWPERPRWGGRPGSRPARASLRRAGSCRFVLEGLRQPPDKQNEISKRLSVWWATMNELTLLILERDARICGCLCDLLQQMSGLSTRLEVRHGRSDGLEALAEIGVDLVFLSRAFVGADFAGLQEVRTRREIPVVVILPEDDVEYALRALEAGATYCVVADSWNPAGLRRSILESVEKLALRRAKREYRISLEESNRKLVLRNQEVEGFYQKISHELRTPLSSAREFVSLTLDEVSGPINQDQREHLLLARDGCDQLLAHIEDLIEVTRLDTGKLTLLRARGELGEVVERAVDSLRPEASRQRIELRAHVDPGLPELYIDAIRIRQVVANLVKNALKFTAKGGSVEVLVCMDPEDCGFVLASVRDTGRGIEPEHLERIFERLYQVESGEPGSETGLGLGLAISRELVWAHGGEIWADSEPGQGSRFMFRLPVVSAERSAPAIQEVPR